MLAMIPLSLIEKILTLLILLLESTPPQIRAAQAIVWWAMWWPVLKLFLKREVEQQVEALVGSIVTPDSVAASKAEVKAHKEAKPVATDLQPVTA